MQIHRLFTLVYLLLSQKSLTADALAAQCEVSKRTILRDIETLSAAGIPIYTRQGRGGGIAILDNFVLNKATLSDVEQNQILLALQSLAVTEKIDAQPILTKLTHLFAKPDSQWIAIDFSRWGNRAQDKALFELIKQAIITQQGLTFRYPVPQREAQKRTIYPLKLLFKSTAWYVQAYCVDKQAYRTFKLTRMRDLSLSGLHFRSQDFSVPPAEPDADDSATTVHLQLRFAPEMAHRIYDEFSSNIVSQTAEGYFMVTFDFPEDSWLYGFLLSFGAGVEVLAPAAVRQQLQIELAKIKKVYHSLK